MGVTVYFKQPFRLVLYILLKIVMTTKISTTIKSLIFKGFDILF